MTVENYTTVPDLLKSLFAIALVTGCTSIYQSPPPKDWGQNFKENLHNAGAQVGATSRTEIGDVEEPAKCEFARETEARLVEMKAKAESVSAADVADPL